MGHQISLVCAIHGYKTSCTDISDEMLRKAQKFVDSYLPGRVEKEKLSAEQARRKISFTNELKEAANDVDYPIEVVIEDLDIKRKVYAELTGLWKDRRFLPQTTRP